MNQNLRSTARLFQSGLFVFWLVFAAADLGAAASVPVTVRFDFSSQEKVDQRWRVNGELPGVNATRFRVEPDDSGNGQVLVVEANRATGILITLPREIDLRKGHCPTVGIYFHRYGCHVPCRHILCARTWRHSFGHG